MCIDYMTMCIDDLYILLYILFDLVASEGGLNDPGRLVQLSLLAVTQSQQGKVSLHPPIGGGIEELRPRGRGGRS